MNYLKPEYITPDEIEKRSFEIIKAELNKLNITLNKESEKVLTRVIHTTADFDYVKNLFFSENAVLKGIEAIRNGADIVTDTNMVKSGINKTKLAKFGGSVHCFISDKEIAEEASKRNVTRSIVSMEYAANIDKPLIFAIGNAPTALIRLTELINENKVTPKLIIGVPVGFVNVVESKEYAAKTNVPKIIAYGRKGGSNVAAAICNALIYSA